MGGGPTQNQVELISQKPSNGRKLPGDAIGWQDQNRGGEMLPEVWLQSQPESGKKLGG